MVKDLAAVAAVMFPVRERKGSSAAETNIRVDPFWSGGGVHHGRVGDSEVLGGKLEAWVP